jgi:hypothetical protein
MLPQVFADGEGHVALEASRREDMAGVAGIGQPLDDRAQALRDAGGRVADAVIVGQQESHRPSVPD